MKRTSTLLALAAVLLAAPAAVAQTLVYDLNGSYADTNNVGPALTPNGGSFSSYNGAAGYVFDDVSGGTLGQGLTLNTAGLGITVAYTIDLTLSLNQTGGYRKIIDFGTGDSGLYNLNTALNFYPVTTGPGGVFSNGGALVDISLSRTADGTVTGSANGVQQFSFVDTANIAIIGSSLRFFIDEGSQGQPGEYSSGFVDRISLTGPNVLAVPGPIAGAGLVPLLGLGAATLFRRRRRKALAA